MIVFKLVVKGQELTLSEQSLPVEKTRNLIKCVFDFQTDDWNGTIKTAYFRNATTGIITSQVLYDNQCLIPIEALSETGYIAFSVAGEKEDYRITSSVVQFFNRATVYGGNSSDPTPSQYEQIMAAAAAAQTAAESAEKTADYIKEQAESGEFNGEPGPQGPKGDTGATGPQGPQGEDGKAATITVGSVTTAQPGTSAAVSNSGTPNAAVLDFVIPQGEKGETGLGIDSWLIPLDLTDHDTSTKALNILSRDNGGYICTVSGYIKNSDSNIRGIEISKGSLIVKIDDSCTVITGDGQYFIANTDDNLLGDCYLVTNLKMKNALAKKQDAFSISNPVSANITLRDKFEYRCQVVETLNLTFPTTFPETYESSLIFESGESATVLSYTADSIKFVGDDCDTEGDFIPQTNKGYEVSIKNLGYNRIIARVGAF